VLAGVADPLVVVTGTGALTLSMLAPVTYPDLLPRDALTMGAVQAAAVLAPAAFSRLFPKALLAWAVAYLVLAPQFYWRPEGKRS
jgi:archaetidylserine synthase